MKMDDTYNVIYTGKTHSDFQVSKVADDFSVLFKLTQEKASAFLQSKRIVKKSLDLKSATAYKTKLEAIGLVIELKRLTSEASALTLTLEPTEVAASAESEAVSANIEVCPKCHLEQPKSEQCTGCGVYMHKVQKSTAEAEYEASDDDDFDEDTGLVIGKPIMAAAVAALVGAFLWKFIAVFFGYELGLIAWLIGGMVGFSAAALGSRAPVVGVACGILALLAILGGKYMAVEAIQANWVEEISTWSAAEEENLRYEYEGIMDASEAYVDDVRGDSSLRQFMVDFGYSEEYAADTVSDDEIADFKEITQPELEYMAYSKPSFDEWTQKWLQNVEEELDGLSTIDLVKEDFGFLDLLFLFLGISTAFRLGKGY